MIGYHLPPEPADDPREDWIAERAFVIGHGSIEAWKRAEEEWETMRQDYFDGIAEDLHFID